jgi:MFS family permease
LCGHVRSPPRYAHWMCVLDHWNYYGGSHCTQCVRRTFHGWTVCAFITVIDILLTDSCRFLIGFGVNITSAAGPIWIVETAHPRFRGVVTGLCNTTWLVGSILAAGAVRGGMNLHSHTSWTLPIWLQMFFPGLIIIGAFLVPESPRWLYAHNKRESAVNTLTKWHGNGNRDSAWVKLQISEYEEYIEMNASDKRWWDYRGLFNQRSSVYRIMTACWFSAFGQWCGNGPLSCKSFLHSSCMVE